MSRHAPPARPISATDTVAEPWSIVRKACGWVVTV
jgi:hypothetical protein